jgi:hypothetical protein
LYVSPFRLSESIGDLHRLEHGATGRRGPVIRFLSRNGVVAAA